MIKPLLQQLLAFLTVVFTSSCHATANRERPAVYWLETKAYTAQASHFAFDGKQAAERLRRALHAKNDRRAAAMELLAIVGDCYLIGRPAKTTTELTGFYVQGTSGRIAYRATKTSAVKLRLNAEKLIYETVEVISEP